MSTRKGPGAAIHPELSERETATILRVDGSDVHLWEYAPVETTGATRTLLLVHGFRGDHHGLARLVEALPDMRILSPDLPGFGSSGAWPDRGHDIAGYSAFVSALLERLSLGPDTVMVGHSFGSIVASHFAAAHPGAIAQLILINPIAAPALEGPKGVLSKLAELYYLAGATLPARAGNALLRNRAIVQLMSSTMAKTKDPELLTFIHGQHHSYFSRFAGRTMLLEAFRASISGTVRQVAAQLRLPVLLIAGEADEIATLPTQHLLMEQLPDAELVVIAGVGHLIHYETPGPAAAAITDFLRRHPA
jgi:pimeloyl-ACP methyl ester carboxylesterase